MSKTKDLFFLSIIVNWWHIVIRLFEQFRILRYDDKVNESNEKDKSDR